MNSQTSTRHLNVSTRRMSKQMSELNRIDIWLEKMKLYRKHAPKDPNCLFRAISEQIYHAQYYHVEVRNKCIKFMSENKSLFQESVTVPFDHYLRQMAYVTEWGCINEIRALSLLYKRDVVVFNGQKQTVENVTNNNFEDSFLLCFTPPKQYETVYTIDYIEKAGFCQSILYQIMYKNVFGMSDIMTTMQKMLRDRSIALRHDKFFHKRNVDIRDQLVADLQDTMESGHNSLDETHFDSKKTPPIPYKAAKALNPDTYRNTDFDTWYELRREVKYGGWNKYNSNQLQVGGKCLINMDYIDQNENSVNSDADESNAKNVQQKSKQEGSWYNGFIQRMTTSEEPVLVFILDLGEKRLVPYDALKPISPIKKNKQNTLTSHNRKTTVTDARRWRKTYNSSSRKRKDTASMVKGVVNDTNKNGINNNSSKNSSIDKADFETNDELPSVSNKASQQCVSENHVEICSNDATNEVVKTVSTVTLDKTQSTKRSRVREMGDEQKKTNAINTKRNADNSNLLNKPAKSGASNNRDNNFQNSYSKPKILDENYPPHIGNSQVNLEISPNLFCVLPDGSYTVMPILPGNFNELGQIDHCTPGYFYNLEWNYGPVQFGPEQSVQPLEGVPANVNMNNFACVQEGTASLINGMQNCSLAYNETAGCTSDVKNNTEPIVSKTSLPHTNHMQNTKLPKQGLSKNLAGKDFSYQEKINPPLEKIKQNGMTSKGSKGNKTRYQQNTRESTQHWNSYGSNTSANAYNSRIITQLPQQHFNAMIQQQQQPVATDSMNTCISCVPPTAAMFPTIPPYSNETADAFCNSFYLSNGAYVPVTYFPQTPLPQPSAPPSYHDATENSTAMSPLNFYPSSENYQAPNYPSTAMCPPMMYPPPQMQFSSVQQQHSAPPPPPQLPPPPSLPPLPPTQPLNIQEHWYPISGTSSYVHYAPSSTSMMTEPPYNVQNTSSA